MDARPVVDERRDSMRRINNTRGWRCDTVRELAHELECLRKMYEALHSVDKVMIAEHLTKGTQLEHFNNMPAYVIRRLNTWVKIVHQREHELREEARAEHRNYAA
jgi:hypothetical protein